MLARMWRKRNTPPLLVGLQACTTTLEISRAVPQKIGHSTTGGSSNTSSGHHLPEYVPTGKKDTCSTMFIAAFFIIVRSRKEPSCPSTEEWIQKMWYIYTVVYYSAIKNWIYEILDKWIYLEDIILSEVSQSQKNTHDMHSLISGY